MGAYLSQPITDKLSTDDINDYLICGASSMQGWRMSQEDAHNCMLNFDKSTSLFAVYDGHGGAEVALYCAQKLPDFLKDCESYKNGDIEQALKDAFIGFDALLLTEPALEELKKLIPADQKSECEMDEDGDEAEDEEDLAELCQEGRMPLNELLERYKDGTPRINKLKKEEGAGSSKPISPYLRGRRVPTAEAAGGSSSSLSAQSSTVVDDKPSKSVTEEEATVSSSSASATQGIKTNDATPEPAKLTEIRSETVAKITEKPTYNSPDSSSANKRVAERVGATSSCYGDQSEANSVTGSTPAGLNGDCMNQENKISTNSGSSRTESVSSSSSSSVAVADDSSSPQERPTNGNISSTKNERRRNKSRRLQVVDDDASTSSDDEDDDDFEDNSSTEDGEDPQEDDDDEIETEDEDEDEALYPEEDEFSGDFFDNMVEGPGSSSGCTAVMAILRDRTLYVANAGDSRCVVCRKGVAIEMSTDHKPEDADELSRIIKAGGRVTLDGRVNGGLNLSRAIGDHGYKLAKTLPAEEQMISALPDIKKITLTPDDEFMILACDGIWNFMSSEEVVEFIKKRLAEGKEKISSICEELFDFCLATNTMGDGTGCDNMTAVIVLFKNALLKDDGNAVAKDLDIKTEVTEPQQTTKRAASPEPDAVTENSKRIKTEEPLDLETE